MVFIVTDDGVVVIDPKPDVSPYVLKVMPQVTDKPITHVIYTHHHRDHSEGAHLFAETVTLIAEQITAALLAVANDPKRPQPDIVFDDEYVLETGGLRFEFKDLGRNWHSQDDLVIWVPEKNPLDNRYVSSRCRTLDSLGRKHRSVVRFRHAGQTPRDLRFQLHY